MRHNIAGSAQAIFPNEEVRKSCCEIIDKEDPRANPIPISIGGFDLWFVEICDQMYEPEKTWTPITALISSDSII